MGKNHRQATRYILVKILRQNSRRVTCLTTHRFAIRHNSMKAPRHNPMKITWFAVVQFCVCSRTRESSVWLNSHEFSYCIARTDSGHERQEPKRRKEHQMHGPLHHITDICATNALVAQTFLSVPLLAQTGMSVPPMHMMP